MDNFINGLLGISIWSVAKLLFLAAFGVYGVFSIVVLRQVYMMTETLNGSAIIGAFLKILAWLHFIFPILLLFLALLIL